MDYTLDEQQNDVRELAESILGTECTHARLIELDASGTSFDEKLWQTFAQAGLVGLALPEEDDGAGLGFVEACLVLKEAARFAARLRLCESLVMTALPLATFGTPEQRARLIAPFAAGDLLLSSAMTVTATGARPRVRAERHGDRWRLSGSVSHVALADRAHRVLVDAIDDEGRTGLFLVDPTMNGVAVSQQSSIDRQGRHHLAFAGAEVSDEDVLAEPGERAHRILRWIHDHTLAARCVEQLGHCEAALADTARFVSERRQFGRPLGTFQAVAHRVADAYIDTEGVRLTAWRAAWLLAEGMAADEELAIASWWAATAPMRIAEAAMHLHGGLSVDLDYPIHRHYLAIKQLSLVLGGPRRRLSALGSLVAAG